MSIDEVLAELKPKTGSVVHVSDWLVIDQARIDAFAEATGDHQWIHTDPVRAARESPYGTTIAHGYLLLSLYPILRGRAADGVPVFPGVKSSLNYGLNKLRFPNAVPAGARVRGRTELLSAKKIRNAVQTIEKFTVEVEGEDKPACVAETIVWLVF